MYYIKKAMDIYDEDIFKEIDQVLQDADKYLEDLYDSELYRDASLFELNKKLKDEL